MSGSETDDSFFSQGSSASHGYNADDELEPDEITNLVQYDSFSIFKLTDAEKDELEKKQEDQKKEEEEEYKVFTQKQIDREPAVKDDVIAEKLATQEVDNTVIEIVEDPLTKIATIKTKRNRKDSHILKEAKEAKELEEQLKKEADDAKEAAKAAKSAKASKETHIQHNLATQDSQFINTQNAYNYTNVEVGSQSTVARKLITNDIRLESITPDSQAKKIFTQDEINAMTSCYICGCKFEDRISAKHNKRWDYPENQITVSYDHSAPINFSAVVGRVPSPYGSYEPFEIEFLKLNGKMACFHCNYTKSQRMFLRCPKDDKGNIDFQNFEPNTEAITKFINDLWDNQSEWSKDPNDENTLHNCVGKDQEHIDKWKEQRIQAITASVQLICDMIKTHVSQDNVIKRFYFTNLLIAKAKELLKSDPYLKDPNISDRTKKGYEKRYIVKFVSKAEATDPRFVTPWPTKVKLNKRGLPYIQEASKETDTETSQDESGQVVSQKKTKTGSSRKRKQTRKRKNKRKTYRGVRLF
jgi:hypothetical protein